MAHVRQNLDHLLPQGRITAPSANSRYRPHSATLAALGFSEFDGRRRSECARYSTLAPFSTASSHTPTTITHPDSACLCTPARKHPAPSTSTSPPSGFPQPASARAVAAFPQSAVRRRRRQRRSSDGAMVGFVLLVPALVLWRDSRRARLPHGPSSHRRSPRQSPRSATTASRQLASTRRVPPPKREPPPRGCNSVH